MGVRVKDPKKSQALRRRWVDEEVAGGRRHGAGATRSSSQKIKIEIAQIPSYTRDLRVLEENYPEVEGMCSRAIIGCQSLDEILARNNKDIVIR